MTILYVRMYVRKKENIVLCAWCKKWTEQNFSIEYKLAHGRFHFPTSFSACSSSIINSQLFYSFPIKTFNRWLFSPLHAVFPNISNAHKVLRQKLCTHKKPVNVQLQLKFPEFLLMECTHHYNTQCTHKFIVLGVVIKFPYSFDFYLSVSHPKHNFLFANIKFMGNSSSGWVHVETTNFFLLYTKMLILFIGDIKNVEHLICTSFFSMKCYWNSRHPELRH